MDLRKGKNIFLAEDDADDRMFFEDALKQVAITTHLTLANDGLELMSNLETVTEPPPPDVIFLDLNMPRKNGFQCLEEIRNTHKLKDIPVVIFSTTDNEDAVNRTYQQGANHYICKPRSFELLVEAIETVLTLEMWQKPQPPKEKFVLAFT
ncbi:MAG: response regulator [Bacteroidota bacterium]